MYELKGVVLKEEIETRERKRTRGGASIDQGTEGERSGGEE